jgi:hypothetical protein
MFAPPARAKRLQWKWHLRPFSINVRFARAGEAFIVLDTRQARVSRFSKSAPPARAKRLQWKIALRQANYSIWHDVYLGNLAAFVQLHQETVLLIFLFSLYKALIQYNTCHVSWRQVCTLPSALHKI